MQVTDPTWVPPVGAQPPRKYNRAWRLAAASACRSRPTPAPFRVYAVTNTENGLQYVGATQRSLKGRWGYHVERALKGRDGKRSTSDLSKAIRKYGAASFSIRVLSEALNAKAAYDLESFWIRELKTLNPSGYNMREGGRTGFRWSSRMRVKFRKAQSSRMQSPDNVQRLRDARTLHQRRQAFLKGKRNKMLRDKAKTSTPTGFTLRTVRTAFP